MKLEYYQHLSKNSRIHSLLKIRQVAAELVPHGKKEGRTEGRTDITEIIVAFRNSANAPKNSGYFSLSRTIPKSV